MTYQHHYDRPLARFYTLFLLMIIYAFNFIDRQLLVIMQESIKADLQLSDSQLGLLSGFAFALFYVLAGIPIARWADKGIRRSIISLSLAVWSFMTVFSGFVNNFVQLLLARIGVGVGEAGCSPPAHSMISDIFPKQSRATAIAFYSMGINIGILFGFLLGGWLNETLGWRTAFFVVGAPGILLALIARVTMVEPNRGASEGRTINESGNQPSFANVMKLLCSRPSFILLSIGAGCAAFCGYAGASWSASFFIRLHDMGSAEVGRWLALVIGIVGAIGMFVCGVLSDYLAKKHVCWYLWLPAITMLISLPFFFITYTSEDPYNALLYYVVPVFFSNAYMGGCVALAHRMVGLRMRALSSAIFFFVLNIIGLGLGPFIIGFVSDLLAPTMGLESIRYALLYVVPPVMILSSIMFFIGARYVKNDLSRTPD